MILQLDGVDRIQLTSFNSSLNTREDGGTSSINFPPVLYTTENVAMLRKYLKNSDKTHTFEIIATVGDTEEVIQSFEFGGFLEVQYTLTEDSSGLLVPSFNASLSERLGLQ